MDVLLTGGAGYIGSHVVRALAAAGHRCAVLDNFGSGHRAAVAGADIIEADLRDVPRLKDIFTGRHFDLVIHLAAYIEAGESVQIPEKYFYNNTVNGLGLLEAMRAGGVKKLVFSSTAAVYGTPRRVPIEEGDRLEPINPYGSSKLCVEYMLRAYAAAYEMGFVALRYFNVAGADPSGEIGEDHHPETHLIPLILQVPLGKRQSIKIFGDDYDTPDGTCIRDYIHVCDLADAHVLAAGAVEPGQVKVFNLGNGEGFSVKQVIDTCRQVTGHEIRADLAARRPGDPPRLVASSRKAIEELGWRPRWPRLGEIVGHAWRWHEGHADGYGDR